MITCEYCTREIVDKLPKESGRGQCGGCHKSIYGLYEEDCRQVILREDYDESPMSLKHPYGLYEF